MMTQTLALLLDAYRDLNARKLFWITLILSGLFIATFGLLGADANGFHLLWFRWDMPMATFYYKRIFSGVVVGFWLTWAAAILALISTAGIFPDLLSTGAIDLYISKPIGRFRLFLMKYLAGLLFVALQVALVAIGGTVLLRIRGGEWKPGLMLAVPIVVCFYSYIFAVVVLLGVLTRSTVAALLLGIVCWGAFWAVHIVDSKTFEGVAADQYLTDAYTSRLAEDRARLHRTQAATPRDPSAISEIDAQIASDGASLDQFSHDLPSARRRFRVVHGIQTFFPKTTETTDLLDRTLFTSSEIEKAGQRNSGMMPFFGSADLELQLRASQHAETMRELSLRSQSLGWVIGTSLGFEAVVLAVAAWVFCRRDY